MHARWVALIAIAACAGRGTPAPEAPKLGPEVDEKTAEADAKGLVLEVYTMAGTGKADNLMGLLSEPLVVFGPRKLDATATRADALVALAKVVVASGDKKHAILSSGSLGVVAAQGGRSAWAVDVISIDGAPLAVTAVLTNNDDLWVVDAATLARTPPKATVKQELKKEAVVPPGLGAAAKADARASGAIEKFQRGLGDPTSWGDDLDTRDEPVVIGPSAGEVTRGKKDIKKLWAKRLKANVRATLVGEISGSVTPDGQLAWVTAPVTRIADDEELTPLRVFAVYEKDGGGWRLTALHESLAIDSPGEGAAFKKFAPPPAAPKVEPKKVDEPPKVAAVKPTTNDKQDKKLAKKKPPVEDEEEAPRKVAKKSPPVEEPKKVTKKQPPADEEEEAPKKVVKKQPVVEDDEDEPRPKKKKKKKPVVEETEDEEPQPKKKKKPVVEDDDEDEPRPKKKKKKKPVEDEDEVEVTDE